MALTAASRDKTRYLTGIRGIAALLVVLSHTGGYAFERTGHMSALFSAISMLASLSVPTFIFLSGYLLAAPVVRDGCLKAGFERFIMRRVRRIFPAYYVALLFSVVIAICVTHTFVVQGLADKDFIGPFFLINDVWGSARDIDNPMWTLPVEWHIYFTLPLVAIAWRRFGASRAIVAALAICAISFRLLGHFGLGWVMPQFYALFYFGVAAQWVSTSPNAATYRALPWGRIGCGAAVIYAAFWISQGYRQMVDESLFQELTWGLALIPCITGLVLTSTSRVRAFLDRPAVVYLGEISYSLYLLHWPILGAISHWIHGHLSALAYFAALISLGLPASLLLASLSYRYIERPFLTDDASRTTQPADKAALPIAVLDSTPQ